MRAKFPEGARGHGARAWRERRDPIHGGANPKAAGPPVAGVEGARDNRPVPTGKVARRALAACRPWRPERPAKGAPERNDLAPEWKTLEADPLAHKTLQNRDSLKATIDADIRAINSSRKSQPLANQRISA